MPMIIKQEARKDGIAVKVEEEKKSEDVSNVYEQMFHTVAAGFVADELPMDLAQKFLAALPGFSGNMGQSA